MEFQPLSPTVVRGPSTGWPDALVPPDGDGSPDLWARDRATGTLWLHPNTGTGT